MNVKELENELKKNFQEREIIISQMLDLLMDKDDQEGKKTDEVSEINIELVLQRIAEGIICDMQYVSSMIDAKYHRGSKKTGEVVTQTDCMLNTTRVRGCVGVDGFIDCLSCEFCK